MVATLSSLPVSSICSTSTPFPTNRTTLKPHLKKPIQLPTVTTPQYHTLLVQPVSSQTDLSSVQFSPEMREQHILNAQRLRTLSFSQAFGVSFSGFHPSSEQPLDCDSFDKYCTHVLVYDNSQRDDVGQPLLVATTRLLDRQGAVQAGHFYSENEFKLANLLNQYPYNVLEMGRTCIHPNYRDVATIHQLWSAIGQVAKSLNVNGFMGCASIPMETGDVRGWLDRQNSVIKLPIQAMQKVPTQSAQLTVDTKSLALPSLLKMYLRMGCSIGSQACYDAEFDCADVFIWLPFEQIKSRYQHYID